MFNLSMGPPELLVTQETSNSAGLANEALSNDDQFAYMFKTPKVPLKVPVPRGPSPIQTMVGPSNSDGQSQV